MIANKGMVFEHCSLIEYQSYGGTQPLVVTDMFPSRFTYDARYGSVISSRFFSIALTSWLTSRRTGYHHQNNPTNWRAVCKKNIESRFYPGQNTRVAGALVRHSCLKLVDKFRWINEYTPLSLTYWAIREILQCLYRLSGYRYRWNKERTYG